MLENQLSRYGAVSRVVPDLAPGAKVFLVSDSDDTTVGPLNLGAEFPVDKDGTVRVYTTIQAAVNAASANRGDVVLVLPGYDQSLAGADSWATAGVTVLGVSAGGLRPTIRYTAKTSEVGVSASNVRVSGLRFLAAADSIARAVDLDTGFSNIRFDNNVFDFNATGNDFRVMLRLGSPRSVIEDNQFLSEADTCGPGKGVSIKGGAPSYSVIRRNTFVGQFDTVGDTSDGAAPIGQDTTDTADTNFIGLVVADNRVMSTDTTAPTLFRLSAGYYTRAMVTGNRFVAYDSAQADSTAIQVGTTALFVDNYMKHPDTTEKLVGDSFVTAA